MRLAAAVWILITLTAVALEAFANQLACERWRAVQGLTDLGNRIKRNDGEAVLLKPVHNRLGHIEGIASGPNIILKRTVVHEDNSLPDTLNPRDIRCRAFFGASPLTPEVPITRVNIPHNRSGV